MAYDRATDPEKTTHLFFGPQHPGVTGNMSIEMWFDGDEITKAITHVGYLHRGFEKLMEKKLWIQNFPLVCRICVPEPDINEQCYAMAIEELSGIEPPERAQWIRTLVLELARLAVNLMAFGGQAGTLGLGTGAMWGITLRDFVLDLFEELTGARIYHIYIQPGGVRRDLPEGFHSRVEEVLRTIEERLPELDRLILNNSVFKLRTKGVGVVDPSWIEEYGLVGPVARGSGGVRDVRKDAPYGVYPQLDFQVVTENGCDIYSRALVRRREIEMSIDLVRQVLKGMPEGPVAAKLPNLTEWKVPPGECYSRVESSRGEYGYYVVSDGSLKPRRVHVRGPSYVHAVPLLERMLVGANIADVSNIMVSLTTCPPEIER
ncbi:MAG TPA: NADH-quinone oxidoreductase subunit D [Candidatus Sabulitectum sp.]|nr:NADH-quinone oxidoreductase subunit D [Candidatus Sabulitectum sp.]